MTWPTHTDYVLRTGREIEAWENLFNRYFYESRFRGLEAPIIDLGPGRCAFTRQASDKIIAVDDSSAIVDRYKAEGFDIRLGSAYDLPFRTPVCPASIVVGCLSIWTTRCGASPRCAVSFVLAVTRVSSFLPWSPLAVAFTTTTRIYDPSRTTMRQLAEDAGFSRHRTNYLFWTRGLRRLIPSLGEDRLLRVLAIADRIAQRSRKLVNRQNLVFEAWA
jgi:hypothetical protein